jgi:hypothetical protein
MITGRITLVSSDRSAVIIAWDGNAMGEEGTTQILPAGPDDALLASRVRQELRPGRVFTYNPSLGGAYRGFLEANWFSLKDFASWIVHRTDHGFTDFEVEGGIDEESLKLPITPVAAGIEDETWEQTR